MKEMSIQKLTSLTSPNYTDKILIIFMALLTLIVAFIILKGITIDIINQQENKISHKDRISHLVLLIIVIAMVVATGKSYIYVVRVNYEIGKIETKTETHVLKGFTLNSNKISESSTAESFFVLAGNIESKTTEDIKREYVVYQSDGKSADTGFVLTTYKPEDTDGKIKIFEHDEKELKEPYVLYKIKKTTLKKDGKDYAFANERTEIQFHVPTNSIKSDNNFDLNNIQSN